GGSAALWKIEVLGWELSGSDLSSFSGRNGLGATLTRLVLWDVDRASKRSLTSIGPRASLGLLRARLRTLAVGRPGARLTWDHMIAHMNLGYKGYKFGTQAII
ncbi:hypothetical protein HK405_008507, partial [Cladochytrium tenue]